MESEQSSFQVSNVGLLDSRQARDAAFQPPARSREVQLEELLFNTGKDDKEPYLKAPTGYVPSSLGLFDTDAVPQKFNPQKSVPQKSVPQKSVPQKSVPQKSVTQELSSQVSTKDAIDTPKNAFNWASDAEAQGKYPPSVYGRSYS